MARGILPGLESDGAIIDETTTFALIERLRTRAMRGGVTTVVLASRRNA
jgi:hypothetical protein